MQDWAEIRHLHVSEGMSVRAIATRLGVARDTVSRALSSEGPPTYVRGPVPSAFDAFEGRVRVLLGEFPLMPATVLAERVGTKAAASVNAENPGNPGLLVVAPTGVDPVTSRFSVVRSTN